MDTANTANARSDFNAVVAGYRTPGGDVYVEEAVHKRSTWEEACRTLIRMAFQHRPKRIGVEVSSRENFAVVYGRVFADEIAYYRDLHKEDPPVIPEPDLLVPQRGASKEQRVDQIFGSAYRTAHVVIKRSLTDLLQEMAAFPRGRYDDLVDAVTSMLFLASPARSGLSLYQHATRGEPIRRFNFIDFLLDRTRTAGYRYGDRFAHYPHPTT